MLYNSVESYLSESIGLKSEYVGSQHFERFVFARMKHFRLSSESQYISILYSSPEEREELIESVIVHETWFFRDNEPYKYLKKFLEQEWIPHFSERKLRIMSLPCFHRRGALFNCNNFTGFRS